MNKHKIINIGSCIFIFSDKGVKMQTMASFRPNNQKNAGRMLICGPILTIQSSRESLILWKMK